MTAQFSRIKASTTLHHFLIHIPSSYRMLSYRMFAEPVSRSRGAQAMRRSAFLGLSIQGQPALERTTSWAGRSATWRLRDLGAARIKAMAGDFGADQLLLSSNCVRQARPIHPDIFRDLSAHPQPCGRPGLRFAQASLASVTATSCRSTNPRTRTDRSRTAPPPLPRCPAAGR